MERERLARFPLFFWSDDTIYYLLMSLSVYTRRGVCVCVCALYTISDCRETRAAMQRQTGAMMLKLIPA